MAEGKLRTWFLRDLLEALDRARRGAIAELQPRLPERLRAIFDIDLLRTSGPTDTVPLAEAEELLLSVDRSLGDGTGQVLESAAFELASRIFSHGAGVVVPGDLAGTVARMHAPLERPFVDVPIVYELQRTETGFTLSVGVPGHPRSTRVLRHLAAGVIRAAQRFSRESAAEKLQIETAALGDRATLEATYRATAVPPSSGGASAVAFKRSTSNRAMRAATQPSLSDEVERILSRQTGELGPESFRTGRTTASQPPVSRDNGQAAGRSGTSSVPPRAGSDPGAPPARTTNPGAPGEQGARTTRPRTGGNPSASSNPPPSSRGFQGKMPSWAGGASISQPPEKASPFAFPKPATKPPPDGKSSG